MLSRRSIINGIDPTPAHPEEMPTGDSQLDAAVPTAPVRPWDEDRRRRWAVQAVVASETHVDALSMGGVAGAALTDLAGQICAQLPAGDSPFGDFYLVATPTSPVSTRLRNQNRSGGLPEDVLICPVRRSRGRSRWIPGRWTAAAGDARFARDWHPRGQG